MLPTPVARVVFPAAGPSKQIIVGRVRHRARTRVSTCETARPCPTSFPRTCEASALRGTIRTAVLADRVSKADPFGGGTNSRCSSASRSVLTTAGGIACHGTLEGWFKCRDQKDGAELFKHRLPSGSIGNVMTYAQGGKQYIGLFSGVGGWAGIGLAAGLDKPTDGLGAVGNYAGLKSYTDLGGTFTVYTLP